ncbi:EIN3-binding F-box protein 2 [Cryptomeria japonica]|uniref:EIN3-binding F-box protein 2 n=1 Tax=Cryptomeria japonica TaxID=3369 RepID=UPI0027DA42FB|nr:EIN3-binding F-box protein 2 [Cryptomeria japonica]
MPTLVKFIGDGNIYFKGRKRSSYMDSSSILSLAPCMERLSRPCKRPYGYVTKLHRETKLKQDDRDLIGMLPDECLYEIFRCLPAARDRSACACVSKRWLMLQSSLQRNEIKRSKTKTKNPGEMTAGNRSESNLSDHAGSVRSSENSFEESCDNGFGELIDGQLVPMDIDLVEKGTAKKVDSEKQPSWASGDLSRRLEGNKATDIRLAAISVGMVGRGGLGKLTIRGNHPFRGVSDMGLSAIGLGCPALRVLILWDCPLIGDKGLSSIAKGCHLLEKLDLLNCPLIGDKGLESIAANCPGLLSLNIESCPQIGNKSLKAIGQRCSNLESLSINNCALVGDEGIMALASNTTKLMKVKLQAVKVTDNSLTVMGHHCKSLIELMLVSLPNVTEKGFSSMGNASGMQKLKLLTVTACRGLTDQSLVMVGQGCPSLKNIFLRKCDFLYNKGLKGFTEVAVSLENLHLQECNMISTFGLIDALGNCSGKLKGLAVEKCSGITECGDVTVPIPLCESLKSVNVRYCPGFGDGCLALLGSACPQVQSIDLSGLVGITDDGLFALLGGCKTSLVNLNLSGCIEVTDRAVFVIVKLFGKSLQSLNFDGCQKLTDQSLRFISECCSVLQDLDVSKCGITDDGIVSFAFAAHNALDILSLSGCVQITDKSLPFIGKLGERLQGLNLQCCSGISTRALDLLRSHLWKCDLLV